MKRSGLALAGTLLALSTVLTACGGGTPSKDDLVSQLKEASLDDKTAECVADKLLDSDLSDDELNAIADDDKSDLDSDEVAEVTDAVAKAATDCVGG